MTDMTPPNSPQSHDAATTSRFRATRRELAWYVYDAQTDSRLGFATSAERAMGKAKELNERHAS